MDGGYDEGYKKCSCFWGTQPGSLILRLRDIVGDFAGLRVLDAGCGEGKNAAFLAGLGASVDAFDVSETALEHARMLWPDRSNIEWQIADARQLPISHDSYDIVIAYGLFHCLQNQREVVDLAHRLMRCTRRGGLHVVCTFNHRHQELHAHPGFSPVLLPHVFFETLYAGWSMIHHSDTDLHETHPHNNLPHKHSMTRLIARKEV
ncbi:MAG TPA: class I SAM-dependent methyltransferase [Tepidisphaeraceae bacterium]|jgi:2-polyprenyl-3-methyl-5-hydroxy-6-metoxy-1,4-benzoquinol methylase|nr:class I SAM-dependent methyltransferase [Tepidisphaeraceae bacterium]